MAFAHLSPEELPQIKQISVNGKRHYETSSGTFISITTLLSSQTPEGILEWRKSVGEDVANYVMRAAATRGSDVHDIIESYLSNKPLGNLTTDYGVLAAGLFNLMVPILDRIDNVRVLEKGIYSERLGIAGRTDCIAEFDGKLSTIDFKTASKQRDEINENYLIQATFYSLAWEELTGQKIDQIAIITGTEDGHASVKVDTPTKYVKRLEDIVEEYKKDFGI